MRLLIIALYHYIDRNNEKKIYNHHREVVVAASYRHQPPCQVAVCLFGL